MHICMHEVWSLISSALGSSRFREPSLSGVREARYTHLSLSRSAHISGRPKGTRGGKKEPERKRRMCMGHEKQRMTCYISIHLMLPYLLSFAYLSCLTSTVHFFLFPFPPLPSAVLITAPLFAKRSSPPGLAASPCPPLSSLPNKRHSRLSSIYHCIHLLPIHSSQPVCAKCTMSIDVFCTQSPA